MYSIKGLVSRGLSLTIGNLRPLINVGCRKKLVNADFEKLAPGFFLIFGKRGYVFKIIRKNTLPHPPHPRAPPPWGGVVGEGVFSNDFENIPFFRILGKMPERVFKNQHLPVFVYNQYL